MAKSNIAFSPKEFKCLIASDNTTAGTTGIHDGNMHQLDVDSVSFPTLNVTQTLDVRSGVGQTLKDEDFFQDNTMRVVELSISGTLHNDTGHLLLLRNICNDVSTSAGRPAVISGHVGASQKIDFTTDATAVANSASSLTVVIQPSSVSTARGLEFTGMVVTNMTISADAGTEGGRYKFSATLQSGIKPDLNSTTAASASSPYASSTDALLSGASGIKVMNSDVVMNSFSVTIDHPAVFSGSCSTGYEVVSRAAKCTVTADVQVKYDNETKTLVSGYDIQDSPNATNSLIITNDNNYGINIQNAVYTNVAYSEGDIMMLDISMESVDDGTDALVAFDVTD